MSPPLYSKLFSFCHDNIIWQFIHAQTMVFIPALLKDTAAQQSNKAAEELAEVASASKELVARFKI